MQDMSCLITEQASSPPRVLRSSDVSHEKSSTADAKVKNSPKSQKNEPSTKRRGAPNHEDPPSKGNQETKKEVAKESPQQPKAEVDDECLKSFPCKVCGKVLSSNNSLEKHLAAHNGEKPFRCKTCDLTFTTNGMMLRHMRVHRQAQGHGSDTDETDEDTKSTLLPPRSRKRRLEFNNNDKNVANGSADNSSDEVRANRRKQKSSHQSLQCPVCEREDFASVNALETHMEEDHPDYLIKCTSCSISFKNHRALNLHRFMVHPVDRKDADTLGKKLNVNSVSGFNDCTFIDFSSDKFPHIAKAMCEKNVHKSVTDQTFRCESCSRDFPCESALEIHAKTCNDFIPQSVEDSNESAAKRRRHSNSTDEEIRRDDFFANLDLQNKSPGFAQLPKTIVGMRKPKMHNDYYPMTKENMNRPPVEDLADIQSILSVTSSGGLLGHLTQKSNDGNISSSADQSNKNCDNDHEEVQDLFAAEFRKMKLRGEFPCRLCTAVFPNLRALKGHNRVHLSGNGPGPYRCNMCPHSSLDKAALVRHMRTHNGDRPYECGVCNYAFTTKANCERHLRNRHSKVTREEVKRSIIYHPSEDPNNDEVNTKLNISREEIKRSMIFGTPESDNHTVEDVDRRPVDVSTPLSHFNMEPPPSFKEHIERLSIPLPRDLSIVIPQPRDIMRAHCSIEPVCKPPQPTEEVVQPRIKVKGIGQLIQIPEYTVESDCEREPDSDEDENGDDGYSDKGVNYSTEAPMDLSTFDAQQDVLDLSKKKSDPKTDNSLERSENDDYIPKTIEFNNNHTSNIFEKTQQFLLARQQLLNGVQMQKLDPAAGFYANQLSQLYRSGATFPGLGIPPAFPLNPYFLQPHPLLPPTASQQDIAEMKERIQMEIIRGLKLSGGGLVGLDHGNMTLAQERLQAFHQNINMAASPDLKPRTPTPVIKMEEDLKPQLHIHTDVPPSASYSSPIMASPKLQQKKEAVVTHSPNSVKMVIKNGVLMPKQKQRRYRTERPFSCEHCSARFTLRSNMERHIKQQHPQYWSQRQRSTIGNLPRKNSATLVPQNITVPSINYENRLSYIKNIHASMEPQGVQQMNSEDKDSSANKPYSMISDQVKYAILAQQLKSHPNVFAQQQSKDLQQANRVLENGDLEEEDEDDALIIDEEINEDSKGGSIKDGITVDSVKENVQVNESNLMAKKVAEEILIGVSAAKTQHHDMAKDFEWKIAGNLISKNPQNAIIPTFVSQIGLLKDKENQGQNNSSRSEEADLVPVSRLLVNSQIPLGKYFKGEFAGAGTDAQRQDIMHPAGEGSEEDEEGLVASSGSTSEGNISGSDENRSESEATTQVPQKKKSAYSLAPNRVSCPYCHRKFPWSSSLRRHVLTHTGQKPYKCPHCPLLFTTKSNCDRHLLRKHGAQTSPPSGTTSTGSPNNAVPDAMPIPGMGNQAFLMRNVPERPYKCAGCPSSTFSSLSNLKKHMASKHGLNVGDCTESDDAKCDEIDESSRPASRADNENVFTSDDEKMSSGELKKFELDVTTDKSVVNLTSESLNKTNTDWESQISTSSKCSPSQSISQDISGIQNCSDLPFKCHLCEGSYAERQDCLDHIKDFHSSEFELLMSKGALETSLPSEDLPTSPPDHRSEPGEDQVSEENPEQLRGKFPDYANRKVVCAFCMRRFWSAEDLRRHMRTHTGERPFSCDVCRRRFTLKHSMLRHRKKHQHRQHNNQTNSDEDSPNMFTSSSYINSSSTTQASLQSFSPNSSNYAHMKNTSTPIVSKLALTLNGYQMAINNKATSASPEIPSNVNNNNSPPSVATDNKSKLIAMKKAKEEQGMEMLTRNARYSSDDAVAAEVQDNEIESGNDLMCNLLGISDRKMISKLLSCPDEAAKLLGVNK